jgi:pSer/pThr/pTyr-binding forkhead associated (FHA) protein
MPDDPHTTLKFPRVVPVETRPLTPSPSGSPEPMGDRPSRPSMVPDWSDNDSPTQRGMQVAIAAPSLASSPDRPLLTVLVGLNAGQVFTLDRDETVLGRGRDADVRIDYVGISRRHARILRTEGRGYILADLGSTNGIFVNGRRVDRVDLANGDRVQVGPRLSFASASSPPTRRLSHASSTRARHATR